MTVLSGFPRSEISAVDASILPATIAKGIYCVQIATQRGQPNTPVYCSSWSDYRKTFGQYIDGLRGTFTLKHLFDRGGKAWVSRAAHYTDVSDASTLVGTKATGTLNVTAISETRATGNFNVTVAGAQSDVFELVSNNGSSVITLGSYSVLYDDGDTDVAAGLRAAVNALTSSHGYSATGSTTNVLITAPVGSGAAANSFILGSQITGAGAGNITAFSGGISAVDSSQAGISAWQASNIGEGYNGIFIDVALSNVDSTKVNITVTVPGGDKSPQIQKLINRAPIQSDIDALNLILTDVKLNTITTRFPLGRTILSGGLYNATSLTDTDYTGDATAKTGLYSFGNITNASRLANLERNTPTVDAAYAAYADLRIYMKSALTFPGGMDFDTANAYRTGNAPYSHSPIDTFRASYIYGDVIYYDPRDVSKDLILSGIGDVCGLRALVDSKQGEWISHAGSPNGVIDQNKGVVNNLADPAILDKAGILYENGINGVVVNEFGTAYWGNRSLYRDTTKLLSKDNVAELVIFIMRNLKIFSNKGLFKPNDPVMWSTLYRTAKLFITNTLVDGQAIVGGDGPTKGEGVNWFWIGDQGADQITDAKFNDPVEVQAGTYRARFVFLPISATEYISIEAVATDANSIQFSVVQIAA